MSSVSQTPVTPCCCHADTSVFVTAVLVVCAIEQATVLFAEHVSDTPLSSPHTLLSSQSSPHRTHCPPLSPLLTAHTALLSVLSSWLTLPAPSSTRSTHNTYMHKYVCHTFFTLCPKPLSPKPCYLQTPAISSACPCSISSPVAPTSCCEALTRGGSC